MRRAAPTGEPWKDRLQGVEPEADANGCLAGPWGLCLVEAVCYEHEVPQWDKDPEYRREGPAGHVCAALQRGGHHRFEKATAKLEKLTHKAVARGQLTAGPGKPDAWTLWENARAQVAVEANENEDVGPNGQAPPHSRDSSRSHSLSAGSRSSSEGSSASGSSCSGMPEPVRAMFEAAGIKPEEMEGLPKECCMNDAVECAPKEAPPEVLVHLPEGVKIKKVKKVSDGWHEGYLLELSAALISGTPPKAFLRIWRAQLSYWRLDVHTGHGVESRAMQLAQEAGLPTPRMLKTGNCARAPQGDQCDWAVYSYVKHADDKTVLKAFSARKDDVVPSKEKFIISLMARLHNLDLAGRDTTPLARFNGWESHLDYLEGLCTEAAVADSDVLCALDGVRGLFVSSSIPDMPVALCHLDWHFGNVLCKADGELQAVIDWEFAGIGDPRLDLARFIRRLRWDGDIVCKDRGSDAQTERIVESYAHARFGSAASSVMIGPLDPWIALESLLVLVLCSAVLTRVAKRDEDAPPIPRCDLEEWTEDAATAKWHLARLALI